MLFDEFSTRATPCTWRRATRPARLIANFYSPAEIIAIDMDNGRLAFTKRFGATPIFAVKAKEAP
jgi:hypothetical protein